MEKYLKEITAKTIKDVISMVESLLNEFENITEESVYISI